ncbi:hypothetical protein ABZ403_10450 [Micromonospora zamorensis]
MHLRIKTVAMAMVVATVGAIAIPTAPASANVSQGYVTGSGTCSICS